MDKKDNDILKRLRAAFRLEAEERLSSMSARLIELEKSPSPEAYLEIAETVFREAHSLKGAARSAGMGEIDKIFQSLESVFAALKRRKIELTPENFDFLHKAVDTINGFLSLPEEERSGEISARMSELKKQLAGLAEENLPADQTPPVLTASPLPEKETPVEHPGPEPGSDMERPALPGSVRISVDKLDSLMLQAQEMVMLKQIASQTGQDFQELLSMLDEVMKQWARLAPETQALRRTLDKKDALPVFSGRKGQQYILNLFDTLDSAKIICGSWKANCKPW